MLHPTVTLSMRVWQILHKYHSQGVLAIFSHCSLQRSSIKNKRAFPQVKMTLFFRNYMRPGYGFPANRMRQTPGHLLFQRS